MKHVYVLIKPASGRCNMRCAYCFYRDEMAAREEADRGMMTEQTLERIVSQVFSFAESECTFAFQGGEPTLVGLEFYQTLHTLIARYNTRSIPVHLSIQTNGLSVDDEWASFWAEHGYLVGLSLDGPVDIHNRFRRDGAGQGTFARVMEAAERLRAHRVEFNILCVVTAASVTDATKLYRFFGRGELGFQQYIPCITPIGRKEGYTLVAERYGKFLCELFDLWYADFMRGKPTYNRTFENWVGMLAGRPPECCGMSGVCTPQMVIEADGSVYPCDFYATDRYLAGNIADCSLEELWERIGQSGFAEASYTVAAECRECRWYPICRGGCRRYREQGAEGTLGKHALCAGFQRFFAYAMPRMVQLARTLR